MDDNIFQITVTGLVLGILGILLGFNLLQYSLKDQIELGKHSIQLKTKCEKDLPRTQNCVLMYLTEEEIKTLGKDMPSE